MKLRMVFDVMFRGDSLTIAITDTSNRLMVSSSWLPKKNGNSKSWNGGMTEW